MMNKPVLKKKMTREEALAFLQSIPEPPFSILAWSGPADKLEKYLYSNSMEMNMSSVREFRLGKGAKTQVWKIWQDGNYLHTEHGQLGGAQQHFSDRPGEKGKPGTKAFVNAEDNCKFHIAREIRKKTEHGYIEYVDGKPTQEQVKEIVFHQPIPKNFCSYKPQTDIDPKALRKLHDAKKARYTRKYDGMSHLFVHHNTGWEAYTRRMDLATERFPNHIEMLNSYLDLGVGTIIVGEVVCYDKNNHGKEDFKAVSSFCRSLPDESRKIVGEGKVPEPSFIIFDVLFHDGNALNGVTYDKRSLLWTKKFPPADKRDSLIASVDYYDVCPDTWEAYAKERGWEGFVVTDGGAIPGEKFFSFDGDAKRPKGHHKLKPTYTEDCIVYAAASGSGKRLDGIGALFIAQIHPETGEVFQCGKTGSGMTDADLVELETICKKLNIPILEKDKEADKIDMSLHKNQFVIELEYGERQPGTNKFRFPVFCRIRDDKAPHECTAQRMAPEEE